MNFQKILNNKIQVLINLIYIQEEFIGGYLNITKRLEKKISILNSLSYISIITRYKKENFNAIIVVLENIHG